MDRTAWAATQALRLLPSLADPERLSGAVAREDDAYDASSRGVGPGVGHHRGTARARPGHCPGGRRPSRRLRSGVGARAAAPRRRAFGYRLPPGGHSGRWWRRGPLPLRVVGPPRAPTTAAPCRPRASLARRAHRGRGPAGLGGSSTAPAPSPGRCTSSVRAAVEHARGRAGGRRRVRGARRVLDAGPGGLGSLRRALNEEFRPRAGQATGRSQMGNQRDRSFSTGRSLATTLFRRSSSSLSRCSWPRGANG